jgi:hypothetical protein
VKRKKEEKLSFCFFVWQMMAILSNTAIKTSVPMAALLEDYATSDLEDRILYSYCWLPL